MLAKVTSIAVYGIDAYIVDAEVDVAKGMPSIVIVGLPDAAVKESRDRVRAAVNNSGYIFFLKTITINLAPADKKKEGPSFDLPIAIGYLMASEQIQADEQRLRNYAVVGELALDGSVRPVKGCLPMALEVKRTGLKGMVLPMQNSAEAAVVSGIEVMPVENLAQAVGFFTGQLEIEPYHLNLTEIFQEASAYDLDFADVKGQEHVKRALTVAAAGNHNVLMIGPPGSGKTMLAQRLPTILPQLTLEESLETTKIYSIVGLLKPNHSLIATRPFRSPHHTISDAGLIGGGTYPRPGEVSLSHHGVLFLDELPEFNRRTLEVLRQPLEDGKVTISRVMTSITYPADIMLVCALNPCPCGYFTDSRRECHCTPYQIQNYMSRISGPLLDRIDIHIEVPAIHYSDLSSSSTGQTSEEIRECVTAAREIQYARFKGRKTLTNAGMSTKLLKDCCVLDDQAEMLVRQAMTELGLSARGYTKVLKVSRTIADLDGSENIKVEHISEAIQYRSLDRNLWQ